MVHHHMEIPVQTLHIVVAKNSICAGAFGQRCNVHPDYRPHRKREVN